MDNDCITADYYTYYSISGTERLIFSLAKCTDFDLNLKRKVWGSSP